MTGKDRNQILRGVVTDVKRMKDFFIDEDGREWRKCLIRVRLSGFSKRTKNRKPSREISGKVVEVVRYCALDWHFRVERFITLTPDETVSVLNQLLS